MDFNNIQDQDRLELDFQTLVDDVKSAAQVLDTNAFNAYVLNTVEDLTARGQVTSDLVVHLLKSHALTDEQVVNPYNLSIAVQNNNHHIATNRPINNNKKKPKGATRPEWLQYNTPPENPTSEQHCIWNNFTWYWCAPATGGKCRGHWRRHSPTECKGLAKEAAGYKGPVYGKKRKARASQTAITTSSLITRSNMHCETCGTKRVRMT